MSYTNGLDNPQLYFQTKLYTGNGSTQAITLDGSENMRPDFLWCKARGQTRHHYLADAIRGVKSRLRSDATNSEYTANSTSGFDSFDNNGFTLEEDSSSLGLNESGHSMVSWNWSAGGSAPAITYSVKVVSDSGNKYRFDDFGTSAVTLDLQEGGTYTFDQSDSSNSGHPLRFSTTSNGTHGGGSEYTTGVTVTGTPGNSGAKTVITVGSGVATLYYYCTQHSAMGGQANTNSTFGSSNFSGSIQSTVSANTTAGFSICTFTNPSSTANFTFGHGLGVAPRMFIMKAFNTSNWQVYHESMGNTNMIQLNYTSTKSSAANWWGSTSPTSSVCTVGADFVETNQTSVAYVFAEKKGYSKFSSYVGNGSSSGPMIVTGFKPAFILQKRTDSTSNWHIFDNKRETFNPQQKYLLPNTTDVEGNAGSWDFLSNGFKIRSSEAWQNNSGGSYIFMAFGESPFVNSKGVPNNAR